MHRHRPFVLSKMRVGYFAAQGLAAQGFAAHGFAAAQGFAAQGLHGLQGFTIFFAAHGFAAHGLAAQGFAAQGFAAHGLQGAQLATSAVGAGSGAAIAIGVAIARLVPIASAGINALWAKLLVFFVIIASLKVLKCQSRPTLGSRR
tara:strand:- start:990 stop:1427 length:438 start_codon:yes stop_codon:yes gene_type:complete